MNAIRDETKIRIYDAYQIKESIKEMTGRFYDPDDKAWIVAYSKENAKMLALLGVSLGDDLLEATDQAAPEDETPILQMPIKAKPYNHQVRAFNFALRMFGIGGKA